MFTVNSKIVLCTTAFTIRFLKYKTPVFKINNTDYKQKNIAILILIMLLLLFI